MATAQLIDKAKENKGLASDYAVAKALNVRGSYVSNWRNGYAKPDIANFAKLAKLAGLTMEEALPYIIEDPTMYIM